MTRGDGGDGDPGSDLAPGLVSLGTVSPPWPVSPVSRAASIPLSPSLRPASPHTAARLRCDLGTTLAYSGGAELRWAAVAAVARWL